MHSLKTKPLLSWTLLVFVTVTVSPFDEVRGEKFFAHSAVGSTAFEHSVLSAEAEIIIAFSKPFTDFLTKGPAKGKVLFLDQAGGPIRLKVFSDEHSGEMMDHVDFSLHKGQQRFRLESPSEGLKVFWATIVEDQGEVDGQLNFAIRRDGNKVTDVTVDATPSSPYNKAVSAKIKEGTRTGVAVGNPTSQRVDYFVQALDTDDSVVAESWRSLPPRGQTAVFLNELFPQIGDEFEGSVVIAASRGLSTVALNQDGLQLSSAKTVQKDQVANDFVLGSVNQGAEDSGPSDSGSVFEDLGRQLRQRVESGTVFFSRGTTTLKATISPEGFFIANLPELGDWHMEVRAPGLVTRQRVVEFPQPLMDINLIDPEETNMCFLAAGQPDGTTFGPTRELDYLVDQTIPETYSYPAVDSLPAQTRNTCAPILDSIYASTKQFVERQLPPFGIEAGLERVLVDQSSIPRDEKGVPRCTQSIVGSILITPNPSLETASRGVICGLAGTNEILGGYIEYAGYQFELDYQYLESSCSVNFSDAELISGVTQRLWSTVFGRRVLDPGICGLDPIDTVMARNTSVVYPSPIDLNQFAVIGSRPQGTKFETDREILPPLKTGAVDSEPDMRASPRPGQKHEFFRLVW